MDNTYHITNDPDCEIPDHWVLTVRTCECGSRLWWDKRDNTWHCMKESCPNYKSHVKRKEISEETVEKILYLWQVLTIGEISSRLRVPEKEIVKILEENNGL